MNTYEKSIKAKRIKRQIVAADTKKGNAQFKQLLDKVSPLVADKANALTYIENEPVKYIVAYSSFSEADNPSSIHMAIIKGKEALQAFAETQKSFLEFETKKYQANVLALQALVQAEELIKTGQTT